MMGEFDVIRTDQIRAMHEAAMPDPSDPAEGWANAIAAQHLWSGHVLRSLGARTPGPTIFLDEERGATTEDDLKRMIRARTPDQQERAKVGAEHAKLRVSVPLSFGMPFFFSDRVCALLEVSAKNVPQDIFLEREQIPCEHGFWYFDRPLPLVLGSIGPIRALTWAGVCQHEGQELYNLGPHDFSLDGVEAIDIVFWLRTAAGSVVPATHMRWLIGESCDLVAQRANPLAEDPAPRLEKLRYLAAALAFIRQRVVAAAPEVAGRAVRRRLCLPEAFNTRPVQVVTLRKLHIAGHEAEPDHVAWACRWGVSGHWRNQAVGPRRSARRLTWVHGHMKGPSDKPVRHVERVFAVRR